MNLKFKYDNEMSPVESEVLGEVDAIMKEIIEYCDKRITNFLNAMIEKHNGLDGVLVYSFFGKLINHYTIFMLRALKDLADEIGDNEITIHQMLDETHEGTKFLLGIKDHKLPFNNKKLN